VSLKWGLPPRPEPWMTGLLIPLGLPVGPERNEQTGLPCYVVTSVAPTDDKLTLEAVISVHSFAKSKEMGGGGRDQADQMAWNAHNQILSCTPGDTVTLANGDTVTGAWADTRMAPTYADYGDKNIKRYVARYCVTLRFVPVS
jgi:hypothetical protein